MKRKNKTHRNGERMSNREDRGRTKGYGNDRRDEGYGRRDDSARNDLSWYSRYPNLLIGAGSFPYPYRPGMDIPLATSTTGGNATYSIPGVIQVRWYPSIGWSETATDPASNVGKEMYARVRKVYAGALDADAPDYVMYLMALDSLFSYISTLKRIYRVLCAWSPDNRIIPDVLLTAMGVNSATLQNFRGDMMNLWKCINQLVLESRKFTCPAVMDIMNRHYWMSDNVYTDDQTINSQFYVFFQNGYFKYAEQNMPSGDPAAGLTMVNSPFGSLTAVTVDGAYQFGLQLIQALVAWDDAYTISGYLSRAFEGTPNFIVDELPLDQPFTPVYEPEVLMQIENARAQNAGLIDESSLIVSQDVQTNAVISRPTATLFSTATGGTDTYNVAKYGYWYPNPVLSIRSDSPSVAQNVIASRLHNSAEPLPGSTTKAKIIAATEIVRSVTVYDAGPNLSGFTAAPLVVLDSTANYAVAARPFALEAFDWHPFTWIYVIGSTGKFDRAYANGDVHNITAITADMLKELHKVCVYSEFNAYSIG